MASQEYEVFNRTVKDSQTTDDEPEGLIKIVPEPLHFLPANHPGYELFPNGFPDLDKINVKRVATKPLDVQRLRDKQKKLQPFLTSQASKDWWDQTLNSLEDEDNSSCTTCREFRLQQLNSCEKKTDNDETKKRKRQSLQAANKGLLLHLQTSDNSQHRPYSRSILFPPSRFKWSNGSYEDLKEDTVTLDVEEKTLVDDLAQQRQEQETHFVGPSKSKTSLGNRSRHGEKNPRPECIEPGHIVIVRSECEMGLPVFVGEVMSCPSRVVFDQAPGELEIEICEYGNGSGNLDKIDLGQIKWQATFRGTEKDHRGTLTTRDEFRVNATCTPSTKAMKPLLKRVPMSSIAEYDTPDRMLTKPSGKNTKGTRRLRTWVLSVLHENPRVNWNMSKKRKVQDSSEPSRKRRKS